MGNRAVVVFKNDDEKHGVYLHWNGGPESVLAFLQAMEQRGWTRMDYASARFVGVVSEFFDADGDGDGCSLGIVDDPIAWKDGCDNGMYIVFRDDNGWKCVHRGIPISYHMLKSDERRMHDGIVGVLARTRAARRAPVVVES